MPGEQADLVLIDAKRPNVQPPHDPVDAALMQTSLANIGSVMAARADGASGGGRLVGDDQVSLDPERWLVPLRAKGAMAGDEYVKT